MKGTPHFTASQFINYILGVNQADMGALGIREDVIITYVGQPRSQTSVWGMKDPRIHLFPPPLLANARVTLMRGPIGAPQAASTIEELRAAGARRLWVLGYAGSLQEDFPLGTVTPVARALSDEGTSRHYDRTGWALPDRDLTAQLIEMLPSRPPASLWTTDAVYRETAEKITDFRRQGCDLVDMETACYFHVGQAIGLQVAALMVVSDELFHDWTPGFGSPPVTQGVAEAWRVLEHLLHLGGQPS